ncbi:MAG: hypothetical protein JST63_11620 [Bacteroidetes bacterium]|nr:hypothetical protein [Bacteroidota bacterium]
MRFWKSFSPIFYLFAGLSLVVFLVSRFPVSNKLDINFLYWGNVFLFILSLVSFLIQQMGRNPATPQLFVRYFYISFIAKFLLVAIVVLMYSAFARKINKVSVLICMVLYLFYMFIEIRLALKEGKKNV